MFLSLLPRLHPQVGQPWAVLCRSCDWCAHKQDREQVCLDENVRWGGEEEWRWGMRREWGGEGWNVDVSCVWSGDPLPQVVCRQAPVAQGRQIRAEEVPFHSLLFPSRSPATSCSTSGRSTAGSSARTSSPRSSPSSPWSRGRRTRSTPWPRFE